MSEPVVRMHALAKRFGAEEGHKFVNAVLDRAAAELRPFDPGRRSDG